MSWLLDSWVVDIITGAISTWSNVWWFVNNIAITPSTFWLWLWWLIKNILLWLLFIDIGLLVLLLFISLLYYYIIIFGERLLFISKKNDMKNLKSQVIENLIKAMLLCCIFGSMFYVIFMSNNVIVSILVGLSVLFMLYSFESDD